MEPGIGSMWPPELVPVLLPDVMVLESSYVGRFAQGGGSIDDDLALSERQISAIEKPAPAAPKATPEVVRHSCVT